MVRSSPRASAGFSRLAASFCPACPPAPIMVCASSMKRMIGVGEAFTSSINPLSRFSNSPFTPAPACSSARSSVRTCTFLSGGGTSPWRHAQREAFHHGRLSHARFTGEDRIVLPAPGENVDHLANLRIAAQHRIDLALACALPVRSTVYWSRFGVLPPAGFGGLARPGSRRGGSWWSRWKAQRCPADLCAARRR